MTEFKHFAYWRFMAHTTDDYRYHRDKEAEEFLKAITETATKRTAILNKGEFVWRAQLGEGKTKRNDQDDGGAIIERRPFDNARMKPLKNKATEGRANPKGIPYLYVAGDPKTAMSEVRPSLHSPISLAKLEICRNLRIVDCSMYSSSFTSFDYPNRSEFESLTAEERERIAWRDVDIAFALPVDEGDMTAEYVPTQIITERFKITGYDGVRYRSYRAASGYNIVLFSLTDAEIVNEPELRFTRSINIEFDY
jgi:hypothetical protein